MILDLFTGNKYLEIPIYQRSYDWKKSNCSKLFDDLEKLSRSSNKSRMHFFGSIIIMIDQDTGNHVIIDGQQRITTIALLLAAIRDILNEKSKVSADKNLENKIGDILVERYDRRIFLIPVKKDRDAYAAIVERDEANFDELSNMTVNYRFFKQRIMATFLSIDELMEMVHKLYIMKILLNSIQDDAQMVFESINSTGLTLTEGDKIRNFMLMNHTVKDQKLYYEKYWSKIDDDSIDLSPFFRDYITALAGNIPNKSDVYESFKTFAEDFMDAGKGYPELFESILYYKRIYMDLVDSNLDRVSKKASGILYHLNHQRTNVSYPFFMRVMDRFQKGLITSYEVEDVLETVENYTVRRSICNMSTNVLNKLFMNLYQTISKVDSVSFPDVLRYVLLSKEGSAVYPRDEIVREALRNVDLYHLHHTCPQVLAIIEHANSDSTDILKRINNQELTIEHIMPQKPSVEWQQELGDGWQDFHRIWVHKLGNLTLTAYNSEYSNRSYSEKRELPDYGFLYSPLRLNMRMKESETWGRDDIMARNDALINDFIRFMPELTTTYIPSMAESDVPQEYTMEEENEFFYDMSIRGYSYKGVEHKSKSGAEAYVSLVKEICSENLDIIHRISKDHVHGHLGLWFTDDPVHAAADKDFVEVCPMVWVYKGISHPKKASLLRKLADEYGVEYKDVAFLGIKKSA